MISRRDFVVAAGGCAAAMALASCAQDAAEAPSPSTTGGGPPATPPPVLADSLPRPDLLEFLDAQADINMGRCHHCAQATFLTLRQGFGLPGEGIFRALTPLPGIAERGETCGAVIGSLLAVGLMFGSDQAGDMATWQACLVPARAFCARFEQELGSTQCGDLLEEHFGKRYNLADPAERAEFLAARPGPSEICGRVVKTAVRIAAETILDHRAS